jgi:hypothetical protein
MPARTAKLALIAQLSRLTRFPLLFIVFLRVHRIGTGSHHVRAGLQFDTNFVLPIPKTQGNPMQYRIERTDPHSGQIRTVRLQRPGVRTFHFKPAIREPVPSVPAFSEPLNPLDSAPLARAAKDCSPEARARRARRRLRQRFEKARRAAKCQVRLCRADQHEMLRIAYAAVRCWQQDGVAEEIERELRAGAIVAISRASSLYLVLLRSALPRLDAKRASKWAGALQLADHHGVRSKRLEAFLHVSGGIEGAARERARPRTRSTGGQTA